MSDDEHYLIPVLEWASKQHDGFSHSALKAEFSPTNWQRKQIDLFFENAFKNYDASRSSDYAEFETIFFLVSGGGNYMDRNSRFVLSLDALFKFIDYSELKVARETAKEARERSDKAIAISVGAVMVSIFVPILVAQWLTQTVKIDEAQMKTLQSLIVPTEIQSNDTPFAPTGSNVLPLGSQI